MVTVVKHEWHSHDRQYTIDLNEDLLAEIYPDSGPGEISHMLKNIEEGLVDIEDIINDAWENGVEIDWNFEYDDCYTDRKGGYDVTYEVDDEYESVTEPEPSPATHKCTKCRWEGKSWETRTAYLNEQGEVLPDDCDDWHDTKDVCPMCDSDFELTEHGKQEQEERTKRMAEIDAMFPDDAEDFDADAPDLEQALAELKQEFEELTSHTHYCTECDWTGKEEDHENEGICPKCCAYTEKYEESKE